MTADSLIAVVASCPSQPTASGRSDLFHTPIELGHDVLALSRRREEVGAVALGLRGTATGNEDRRAQHFGEPATPSSTGSAGGENPGTGSASGAYDAPIQSKRPWASASGGAKNAIAATTAT